MRRGVPGHRGRVLVTLQAEIGACFLTDFSVWIVAGFAIEPTGIEPTGTEPMLGAKNLMRVRDLFKLLHAAVTTVADLRRNRAQMIRGSANGRLVDWR